MTNREQLQRTRDELGSDLDVAMKILTLLLKEGCTSDSEISERLGLDLLEVARLMAKLKRLGLVM